MDSPARLLPVFRALADETRLRILSLLASGETCVCHIHGALGIPQPTASRHLAYLRLAGLVETRRDGLWVHYRLAMPDDEGATAILRAALATLGDTKRVGTDRKRLSRVTAIPLRTLEETTACCLAAVDRPEGPGAGESRPGHRRVAR